MGFPILGDPQYGSKESLAFSGTFGFTYQQLCAKKLSFCHPITGVPMILESRMDVEL
jgi:23S rRNA-/tRNA-specific pseudouridylate synthase